MEQQNIEATLARIEGKLAEGLAGIRGELAVFRQQVTYESDRRTELSVAVAQLDTRVDMIEKSAVTHEDMKEAREVMEKRASRTLQWVSFIVGALLTAGGLVITVAVAFLVR